MLEAHRTGAEMALRTSGTSGTGGAVVRTTASWFDSFPTLTRLLGMTAGSRVWVPGPLTGTMNLFAAVHATALGAAASATRAGATHAVLTPAALSRALAQDVDLSDVHLVVAGDRLSRSLHDAALDGGARAISHYYGAAELSFVAWGAHEADLRPFPDVEVESRQGVLWVRSPYVCSRYDGPDGPMRRGEDGFVTVGDRGSTDGGCVRVHGRGGETVLTAGATVVVADVEAALRAATGQELAVVGVPHPDLGEVLCAVVTDGDSLPVARALSREVLEPSHRPRRWYVAPDLPLTPAGKLDRDRLRRHLERDRSVGAP